MNKDDYSRQLLMKVPKKNLVSYAVCLEKTLEIMAEEMKRLGQDDDLTSGEIYRYYMSQADEEEDDE